MNKKNKEIFDGVGFFINVEARGPFGPALLFETSPGNERIMELYTNHANYPYTYSLTNMVYQKMPNGTDFTIVKDSIPGINLSAVADINHYHTSLDNLHNISEKTIQHYGAQVVPVALTYLTDPAYADIDSLKADDDTVNFTVPVLGLFNFSKGIYKVINVAVFVIFLLLMAFAGVRGRIKAAKVFKASLICLASAIGVLILGELAAWICALISGARFKLFGIIAGVSFDNVAMAAFTAVMAVICVLIYMSGRKKAAMAVSGSMYSLGIKQGAW